MFKESEWSGTPQEHGNQNQLTGVSWGLIEITESVHVQPRSSAYMLWISTIVFLWDS